MSSIDKESKGLNGSGLGVVWMRIAQFVGMICGDVRVDTDGSLQEQIDKLKTGTAEEALEEITDLKESLIQHKVNFRTTTENGEYLTTEDGSIIISEFKI